MATGPEEQALRKLADGWIKERLGTETRIIHELAMGDRRIDLLAVAEKNLKGPKDKIDDRVVGQLREYRYFIPEVWLLLDVKWQDHEITRRFGNVIVAKDGALVDWHGRLRNKNGADRDELCVSRLLELLWREEAARIAERTSVIPGCRRHSQMTSPKIKKMLARLLTGNEIIEQVCTELRSRPLTGIGSDAPKERTDGSITAKLQSGRHRLC